MPPAEFRICPPSWGELVNKAYIAPQRLLQPRLQGGGLTLQAPLRVGDAVTGLPGFRVIRGLAGTRLARCADFPPSVTAARGPLGDRATGRRVESRWLPVNLPKAMPTGYKDIGEGAAVE